MADCYIESRVTVTRCYSGGDISSVVVGRGHDAWRNDNILQVIDGRARCQDPVGISELWRVKCSSCDEILLASPDEVIEGCN